jgi:hypothetical protein
VSVEWIEALAKELERPRELSPRVLNYIGGTYEIDHDAIGSFLHDQLQTLEDDEVDLVLSPVFTPKLADQAVFANLLGRESIPRYQWPDLIQKLAARPTIAKLVTLDGQAHAVALREVTLERYVHRLRLEGAIPETVFGLIAQVSEVADHPMLKAIARRAVWEAQAVREILVRYLTRAGALSRYRLTDAIDLLNLVEGRKPAGLGDLLARIPGWQKALKEQIDSGSGSKSFFSEDVRLMHGGDRDQRQQGDVRMSAKEREFEFLVRLEQILRES